MRVASCLVAYQILGHVWPTVKSVGNISHPFGLVPFTRLESFRGAG